MRDGTRVTELYFVQPRKDGPWYSVDTEEQALKQATLSEFGRAFRQTETKITKTTSLGPENQDHTDSVSVEEGEPFTETEQTTRTAT